MAERFEIKIESNGYLLVPFINESVSTSHSMHVGNNQRCVYLISNELSDCSKGVREYCG